jgi:hypothetical protein
MNHCVASILFHLHPMGSTLREKGNPMTTDEIQQKPKKPRSDKGTILWSPRDEYCLTWIAHQYAARLDQIQQLLSRFPGGELKDKRKGLAPTTVKDQIRRWTRAGWIEYERVLVNQPGWAWITKKGLQAVDLDGFYRARPPSHSRLAHIFAVNQMRLLAESNDYVWKSERAYRAELSVAKGQSPGPIPDAIVTHPQTEDMAVEVELTAKKPDDLEKKIHTLASHSVDRRYVFSRIWFYVPDEKIQQTVLRAHADLIEDYQKRVEVVIIPDLLP